MNDLGDQLRRLFLALLVCAVGRVEQSHRVNELGIAILEEQADQEAAAVQEDTHDQEDGDEE